MDRSLQEKSIGGQVGDSDILLTVVASGWRAGCHTGSVPICNGNLGCAGSGEGRQEGWCDASGRGLAEDRRTFRGCQALEPVLRCGCGDMCKIGGDFCIRLGGVAHGDPGVATGAEGGCFSEGVEDLDVIGRDRSCSSPSWDEVNRVHRWCG